MNKKSFVVTIMIQGTCFVLITLVLSANPARDARANQAIQVATPVIDPFIGEIYYGQEEVWKVFDHELPGDRDDTPYAGVRHYDGSPHEPDPDTGEVEGEYGYNGHLGIDYSIQYEPVLAAADGEVIYADWQNDGDHREGLGLHVKMSHTANEDYTTSYGHLSSLVVEEGDRVTIDPENLGGSYRILGIGGNTGHVFGTGDCLPIPQSGPGCGRHLHFEVRWNNRPVNPYGWIGVTDDPWAIYENPPGIPAGATSYDLWVSRPAIDGENQYGADGPALEMLEPQIVRTVVDNDSPDFKPVGECWNEGTHSTAMGEGYLWAEPVTENQDCVGFWHIPADAFTPPGDYEVYVHIPNISAVISASLGAEYRIDHNSQSDTAVVVQATYPNANHDQWAYIGRYDFAMNNLEQVRINSQTTLTGDEDEGHRIVADAIRLSPAFTSNVSGTVYISPNSDGELSIGELTFQDEDILRYDGRTETWFLYFDGSDVVPATTDVDAFQIMADGTILMSFDTPTAVPGLGTVDDSNIIQFTPSSLGDNTAGTFSSYRTAAELGLDPNSNDADVDAFGFTPDGRLVISTFGPALSPFQDEDLLVYDSGSSSPSLYFDGSDIELNADSEDIIGTWIDSETGQIYLSTLGDFLVNNGSFSGDGSDIFICTPTSLGSTTTCTFDPGLYWNGSGHGFAGIVVDSFTIAPGVDAPPSCGLVPNCSFEISDGADGFLYWIEYTSSPPEAEWHPSYSGHSGYMSVEGKIEDSYGETAQLNSEPITLDPNKEYRFSFYARTEEDGYGLATIIWHGSPASTSVPYPTTAGWQQVFFLNGGFYCPPFGATAFHFEFAVYGDSGGSTGSVFLDDILVEVQPGPCPLSPEE